MEDNSIYEPIEDYEKRYRDLHAKNTSEFFEDLVSQAGVDEEANIKTVRLILKYEEEINNTDKKINKFKKLRTFITVLFISFLLADAYLIYNFTQGQRIQSNLVDILIIAGVSVVWVGLILIILKVNKKIRNIDKYLNELKKALREQYDLAWSQMSSLNSLYDWGMPAELVQKTIPLITMDPYFNPQRYDILHNKYGLIDNSDVASSVLYVQSGEITGNPFILGKKLHHYMGTKTYYGYLDIYWKVYTERSDGTIEVTNKSQRLEASINRPFPEYYTNVFLAYGNEAAPDLTFSRKASNVGELSEKKIEKKIEKGSKEIQKLVKKDLKKGGDFTAMADAEFDVLFNALNRNNEVQFRLLFTPLAQKQMVKIIKDKTVGFGDDFDFYKENTLNTLYPRHLKKADINTNPYRYMSYDLEKSRSIFNEYNNSYFKSVYFSFAPLLAIPLYQQHKPSEYIYKDILESNVSCWEHESIVNDFDVAELEHENSNTTNILKTNIISSTPSVDELAVTAYGYQAVREVDYVTVRGGDGDNHQVPVEWDHYYPVSKTSRVVVKVADQMNRNKYIDKINNDNQWSSFINKKSGSTDRFMFRRKLISFISDSKFTENDAQNLDNLLENKIK